MTLAPAEHANTAPRPAAADADTAAPAPAGAASPRQASSRFRAAILFALDGDLRYLSHRDEIRMLERALVRAGWPLKYSQGFNPQPRMSLPLPRPVGMCSASELALVELSEATAREALADSLGRQLPQHARVLDVIVPATHRSPQPRTAEYECELSAGDAAIAEPRIAALLGTSTLVVERLAGPRKPPVRSDVRPYLLQISLLGQTLKLRVAFDQQRSARPGEVLVALGLNAAPYAAGWRRVKVTWDIALALEQPQDATIEE